MIKKYAFPALASAVLMLSSCDVVQQLPSVVGTTTGPASQTEAGMGVKEALGQGVAKAVLKFNTVDGFFKDAVYKILMPPEAQRIENSLRSIGMGNLVDKAILSINRGAEDAVGYAKPIFVDAIKEMTLQDAIGLVRNGDTSITNYFRTKTTARLHNAFKPVIESSLQKVDATRYYGDVVNTYNNLPTTFNKVNPDLASYVTERATYALFEQIKNEERNIRTNFAARTSDLLRKVFSGNY